MNYERNFLNNGTKINDLLRYYIIIDCLTVHRQPLKSFLCTIIFPHTPTKQTTKYKLS